MNRLTIFAILIVVATLLVVRCSTPAATMRLRITVEVSTPGGIRKGSSVMELQRSRGFLIPMPGASGGDRGANLLLFGEAPFVETGGETLFMTFHDRQYRHDLVRTVVAALGKPSPEGLFDIPNREQPEVVVDPKHYPSFARFANLDDPQSYEEVQAGSLDSATFNSMSIAKITIGVVRPREPLTTLLSARFPELARKRGLLALYHEY